jgi:hypothetical protein
VGTAWNSQSIKCIPSGKWSREVCNHTEVVTGPDTVDWFIEDALACRDAQRGSEAAAAHEDVVDAAADVPRPSLIMGLSREKV